MTYLTVNELAARWRKHPVTVRRFLEMRWKAALVKARKIGKSWLIPLEGIEAYEESRTVKARLQ